MLVHEIPMLEDNYGYLLIDEATKEAAAIDAVEADTVLAAAAKAGVTITHVLTTHKHWDHAGGNAEMLKRLPKVPVLGGVLDDVTACTQALQDGDTLRIGRDVIVSCVHTPGHTNGHLCYVATSEKDGQPEKAVFTGDTLFVGGAGRFFEGSPEEMHSSLSKLASLPPETSVYCGHEYTLQNYKFALSMEPNNTELTAAVDEAKARRAEGLPTVPSTIAKELATNPFMRVLNPAIQERVAAEAGVALEDLDPSTVLGVVREMKNNFGEGRGV